MIWVALYADSAGEKAREICTDWESAQSVLRDFIDVAHPPHSMPTFQRELNYAVEGAVFHITDGEHRFAIEQM